MLASGGGFDFRPVIITTARRPASRSYTSAFYVVPEFKEVTVQKTVPETLMQQPQQLGGGGGSGGVSNAAAGGTAVPTAATAASGATAGRALVWLNQKVSSRLNPLSRLGSKSGLTAPAVVPTLIVLHAAPLPDGRVVITEQFDHVGLYAVRDNNHFLMNCDVPYY